MSSTTITVSTSAELYAALATATGGDRIELEPGDYGDVIISRASFSSEIVITGSDLNAPPKFNSITIANSANITVDNVNLDFTPTAETLEWSSAFRVVESSGIGIINSTITGGNAVAGIDPDSEPGRQGANGINGYPIGVGITFNFSSDVTIANNIISEFSAGVRFSDVDGIEFNENEIFNVRKVPVGGGNVSNVHMEANYFHDLTPWKFGGAGDHGDFVHFWTRPDQEGPSENFVFLDNVFAQGDGVAVLGIYLDDNTNDIGFKNVLIEGNVMHNGNAQGLRMEDVDGLIVQKNTLLQGSGDENDAPFILLADGTKNVVIDQNIFAGITGPVLNDLAGNNISILDNLVVQIHDPLAENYVGGLFVNALAANPTLADLQSIPNGMADGYGASATQFGAGSSYEGFISDDRGTGLALSTHLFDVLSGTDGSGIPDNAVVTWDFGDGTSGTGASLSHNYADEGIYRTTATVTLSTGATYTLQKTIQVLTPIPLYNNFDNPSSQERVASSPEMVENGVVIHEDSDFGQSIRLGSDKSTVKFDGSTELLNNTELTISMAFKKDLGTDGGRIFYFSGTAVIDISSNGIYLRGKTSDNELIELKSSGIGINDSNWHQITYTASQVDGTAILYVDGQEVARLDGLTGAQHTTSGHGLHLGNPFGANMPGLLDGVAFLRAALTPEQVQEQFAAFETGSFLDFRNTPTVEEAPVVAEPTVVEAPTVVEEAPVVNEPPVVEAPTVVEEAPVVNEPPVVEAPTVVEEAPVVNEPPVVDTYETKILYDNIGTIQLDGSKAASVAKDQLSGITESDNFDISFTFEGANTKGNRGELFSLNGVFTAAVSKSGALTFELVANTGSTVTLKTQGYDLDDGALHDVSIQLENGQLKLVIDGALAAQTQFLGLVAEVATGDLTFGDGRRSNDLSGDITGFGVSVETLVEASSLYTAQDYNRISSNTQYEYELDIAALTIGDHDVVLKDNATVVPYGANAALQFDGDRDYASLGRLTDLESSHRVAFSVDFSRDVADGSMDRLVWNHMNLGLALVNDGLQVHVATADQGFKTYRVDNIGLNDTDLHKAVVMLDDQTDRLQVVVDNNVVLDTNDADFTFASNTYQSGWTIGTAWNLYFDGAVTDFRAGDSFDFLEDYVPAQDHLLP